MKIRHTKADDQILFYLYYAYIHAAQLVIGFERAEYYVMEERNSLNVSVKKRGINIRDLMIFIYLLNYTEFENMGLTPPFRSSQVQYSAECK